MKTKEKRGFKKKGSGEGRGDERERSEGVRGERGGRERKREGGGDERGTGREGRREPQEGV